MKKISWIIILSVLITTPAWSKTHVLNLHVGYKTVYFGGKAKQAIAVNQQIPAPTLHFKEGDHVIINVYNYLKEETAIHWHGLLVPWQMDGVLGITQHGIPPGGSFQYQFTLNQAGTYWYHAHAGLQEQQGLYGGFVIDPHKPTAYQYNKDYVIVLSDWSNTNPNQILDNLKKDGDYYSPKFPLQPSLVKFISDYRKANREDRIKLLDDYKMMQQMRMSLYDLSDVAYDAFLLNGQSTANPWTALVKQGDVVRLRFIGAGGDTIFHVKIPDTAMKMIHIQGSDIRPYPVDDFTVAPGETYDVLVSIQQNQPTVIYAEASDQVGAAYGALITSPHQAIDYSKIQPFPEPLPVTQDMMANMMMSQMKHSNHGIAATQHHDNHTKKTLMSVQKPSSMKSTPSLHTMSMGTNKDHQSHHFHQTSMSKNKSMEGMSMHEMDMNMPMEPTIIGDTILSSRSPEAAVTVGTKYQNLIAAVKTNDPDKPVDGVIKMELFGYMGRFIWMINGLPEYNAKPIIFEPGKRYRIIFSKPSMMHHPMHIHSHWFILRNGHGAYDPLLHTLDIPPGATVTADIDADASGQSFFHCHLLYHMVAGMSRVFQYSTLIEITKGEAKPENMVEQSKYANRPIVRVDEIRPIDVSMVKHPMAHATGLYFANFVDLGIDPFHNVQKVTYKGMYGLDYNKLELSIDDAEITKGALENADLDIFYWRLLDQFWAFKAGMNYFYRPHITPYWQPGIGIEGMMPYFIDTNIRGYYHSGSAKLDMALSRDTQITNNFFIRLGVRSILASKTVTHAVIGRGLNQMSYMVRPYYRLMPGLNIFAEYENEKYHGKFKQILQNQGESSQNTFTFGIAILF